MYFLILFLLKERYLKDLALNLRRLRGVYASVP